MAEPIDFAATIASLQEQIDTLNGELAGHRKLIETGDIDAFWLLFGGVLVFWMQAGFAMLEVGSVSKKNTKNILVKNIFDARPHNDDADDAASAGRLFGDCGVIDFAGSGTPVYQALGIFILWMGWYGFNCCSTLYIDGYAQSAAHVAVTTTLGAAAGCLSTSAIGYAIFHYIDPGYVYNGVLAGLVGITSPCAVVSPAGAVIIGALAGPVYVAASTAVKKAGIDDAVDAFAVHGACGMWGVIAAGLFATPYYYTVSYYSERKDDCAGIFYGGKATGSFAAAFACIGVILAWVGSTMTILFGTLSATGQLRVTAEVEATGLDDSKHGGAISDVKVEDIVAKGEGIGGGTVVIPSEA
ncbi:ammonium transmembrane transporter [Aureococcus anophagefferens]|uniref:Ammonium transmembrane transporter n=1 Tax=Aureococcus anophagefferens TaxID=44056 RepID=A0ABR1FI12_AURAN